MSLITEEQDNLNEMSFSDRQELSNGYKTFNDYENIKAILFLRIMKDNTGTFGRSGYISKSKAGEPLKEPGFFIARINKDKKTGIEFNIPLRFWDNYEEAGFKILDEMPELLPITTSEKLKRIIDLD